MHRTFNWLKWKLNYNAERTCFYFKCVSSMYNHSAYPKSVKRYRFWRNVLVLTLINEKRKTNQ